MQGQELQTGNRCGHDPARPRLELADPIQNRGLHVIRKAATAASRIFYESARAFPELGPRRSERREAIVLTIHGLLRCMDVVTLRVGRARSDDDRRVVGITVETLARWTGMSRWRLERSLTDLYRAGYVRSKQPRELHAGEYVGLPAVRQLTLGLFRRLGVDRRLERDRKRFYRDRFETRRPAAMPGALAAAFKGVRPLASSPAAGPGEDENRERIRLAVEIRAAHPDWEAAQVRAEVDRSLRPPGSTGPH